MRKVLKFHAWWCGPCKMLSRTLKKVQTDVEIEEIDVDKNKELAAQYNIRGIPTLVMLEDGVEIRRTTGGTEDVEEISKFLNG